MLYPFMRGVPVIYAPGLLWLVPLRGPFRHGRVMLLDNVLLMPWRANIA